MPLYELFCIASHNPTSPVCPSPPFSSSYTRIHNEDQLTFKANLRQLVSSVSSVIHNNGGVVRDLKSLGKGVTLPMKFRANQAYHTHGE
jgi:small subunit ribosomal protein S6